MGIDPGGRAVETGACGFPHVRGDRPLGKKREALAQDDWERVIERTYGLLVAEFGRDGAKRFFPSASRTALSESVPESDDELEPTQA